MNSQTITFGFNRAEKGALNFPNSWPQSRSFVPNSSASLTLDKSYYIFNAAKQKETKTRTRALGGSTSTRETFAEFRRGGGGGTVHSRELCTTSQILRSLISSSFSLGFSDSHISQSTSKMNSSTTVAVFLLTFFHDTELKTVRVRLKRKVHFVDMELRILR